MKIDAAGRRIHESTGRWLLRSVLATMTGRELSRRSGVPAQTISDLARGLTRVPNVEHAFALESFGIPPKSWIQHDGSGPPVTPEATNDEETPRNDAAE